MVSLGATAVLLLGAACGDDGGKVMTDGAGAKDKNLPTLAIPTTLPDAAGKPCKAASGVKKVKGKPEVEVPEGKPPTKLVKEDLKVGTKAAAKVGDTISVQYVGIACSTGKQFDASWDSGKPADFELKAGDPATGTAGVIQGWVDGIPGMKVGGRRQLVIPPDLAYGAEGRQGIGRNETLVFVIDLLDAKATTTTTTTVPGASSTTVAGGSSTTTTSGSTTTNGSTTTTTSGATTTISASTTTGG